MGERGEAIAELQEKTEQLNEASATFAAKVRELRRREERKSMCKLSCVPVLTPFLDSAFGFFDF